MTQKCQTTHNGFTLLELLIAITVFAVMTVMAYGGLSNVIANSESSKKSLVRLQEIQQTVFNIERDFSQITERSIRDEFGETQKYLTAGDNIDRLIEFTRNGRRNPANLLRSHLVRVAYKLEDGNLIRIYWPHLDRSPNAVPFENILLTAVNKTEFRFLDNNSEWHSEWPPLNPTRASNNDPITLSAIEFILTLDDWGNISRLFKVKD